MDKSLSEVTKAQARQYLEGLMKHLQSSPDKWPTITNLKEHLCLRRPQDENDKKTK